MPIVLDWLREQEPDALCLQETKVEDKDFPAGEFEDAGFHVAYRGQKRWNGVAIISKAPRCPPWGDWAGLIANS